MTFFDRSGGSYPGSTEHSHLQIADLRTQPATLEAKLAQGYYTEWLRISEVLSHVNLSPDSLTENGRSGLEELTDAHACLELHCGHYEVA